MSGGPYRADGSFTLAGVSYGPAPGPTMEVRSPVDGSVVGAVHEFDPAEIDKALEHVG